MENNDLLINKVRRALIKSGFPLELSVTKILNENDWNCSVSNYYYDFETSIYREYDIHASKTVNGISVNLFIECKKSEEKQIILYCPQDRKIPFFMDLYFKSFPRLPVYTEFITEKIKMKDEFAKLPIFDSNYKLAKGIIFSKGEKIEQDNSSFFSSFNGLVKQSVMLGYDGFIDTNFRIIFLYIVIYEGHLYELTNSREDDFALNEIDYGQYAFEYHFKVPETSEYSRTQFLEHLKQYGVQYLIEILKPSFIKEYLQKIESIINSINKENLAQWGRDWPAVPKNN